MANTLTGTIQLKPDFSFLNSLDLTTVTDRLQPIITETYADGTGANKAQVTFHDRRTLATTTAEELDLAGSLKCAFGTVTFTKIKAMIIRVVTTTAGYRLEVGGAAANAFETFLVAAGDAIKIGAGGTLMLTSPVDGFAVTADTADLLKIYNPSGGEIIYDIILIGEGSVA